MARLLVYRLVPGTPVLPADFSAYLSDAGSGGSNVLILEAYDVSFNHLNQPQLLGRCVDERELLAQEILQRLRPARHVLLEVVAAVALLVDAVAADARVLSVEMVGPVLIDFFQAVEVFFAVAVGVDDQLGARVALVLAFFLELGGPLALALLGNRVVLGRFLQFQHRVFNQLLLDAFLQSHDG